MMEEQNRIKIWNTCLFCKKELDDPNFHKKVKGSQFLSLCIKKKKDKMMEEEKCCVCGKLNACSHSIISVNPDSFMKMTGQKTVGPDEVSKYEWHTMSDRFPKRGETIEYRRPLSQKIMTWQYGNCGLPTCRCDLRGNEIRVKKDK